MNTTGRTSKRATLNLFPRPQSLVYTVVSVAEFLGIFFGNALVVYVFTRTRRLRQRRSYWLTISLAVADLLVGLLGGPSWLFPLLFGPNSTAWQREVDLAANTAFLFVPYASLLNLVLVALERAYATLWPLKHRVLSSRAYHVAIALGWTLPLFFPLVDLAERRKLVSAAQLRYTWLFCNWFLLTLILFCYVSIWLKMKFFAHHQNHVTTVQERQLTATLLFVTAVSIVTWVPAVVFSTAFNTASVANLPLHVHLHIYVCLSILFFANSLVNPIIYSFRMPQFRREASRLFCRRTVEVRLQPRTQPPVPLTLTPPVERENSLGMSLVRLRVTEVANRPAVVNVHSCAGTPSYPCKPHGAAENLGFTTALWTYMVALNLSSPVAMFCPHTLRFVWESNARENTGASYERTPPSPTPASLLTRFSSPRVLLSLLAESLWAGYSCLSKVMG